MHVELMPCKVFRIAASREIHLPESKHRNLPVLDCREGNPVKFWDENDTGAVKPASEVLFKEGINTIECSLRRTAGNKKLFFFGEDQKAVTFKLLKDGFYLELLKTAAFTDDNFMGGRFLVIGYNRYRNTGNLFKVFLKFAGSFNFIRLRIGRDDDPVIRLFRSANSQLALASQEGQEEEEKKGGMPEYFIH